MKLVSHGSGEITVCNFTAGCQAEADMSEGGDHCDDDFSSSSSVLPECDDVCISDAEMSALVFLAGYVGFQLKRKFTSIDCRLEFFYRESAGV